MAKHNLVSFGEEYSFDMITPMIIIGVIMITNPVYENIVNYVIERSGCILIVFSINNENILYGI